jgi:hypothetical protein
MPGAPRTFSARNRSETEWIHDDFPATARLGLLHHINELVHKDYLDWSAIAKEIRRASRASVRNYDSSYVASIKEARDDVELYLQTLDWPQVYDLCERLHNDLVHGTSFDTPDGFVTILRTDSQQFVTEELERLFEEERLGYEFRDGQVQRRTKRHTIELTGKAEVALLDLGLRAARMHFSKALRHFRDRDTPDYENSVKEAVCAVEAAAKGLFPESKAATLGDFAKWATRSQAPLLPKPLGDTVTGIYAFRNSGEGVSHGATAGGAVTAQLAEYVLAVAASQVILLASLVKDEEEAPF